MEQDLSYAWLGLGVLNGMRRLNYNRGCKYIREALARNIDLYAAHQELIDSLSLLNLLRIYPYLRPEHNQLKVGLSKKIEEKLYVMHN